jgi:hypothetical protein
MNRRSAIITGLFATFVVWVVLFSTVALAQSTAPVHAGGAASGFQDFVDLLKSGGPLSVAVLAGWFAYKKDQEKNDAVAAAQSQMKEMYEKVLTLATAQTAATTQMAGAVVALKEAVVALGAKIENELVRGPR